MSREPKARPYVAPVLRTDQDASWDQGRAHGHSEEAGGARLEVWTERRCYEERRVSWAEGPFCRSGSRGSYPYGVRRPEVGHGWKDDHKVSCWMAGGQAFAWKIFASRLVSGFLVRECRSLNPCPTRGFGWLRQGIRTPDPLRANSISIGSLGSFQGQRVPSCPGSRPLPITPSVDELPLVPLSALARHLQTQPGWNPSRACWLSSRRD